MYLGLDLASRLTGWCCGRPDSIPECGTWEMPPVRNPDGSHDYGELLCGLQDYLNVTYIRFRFTHVAYESPILITRRTDRRAVDSLAKLRLLYPLGPFVQWWCRRREIPCVEKTVAAIKTEITGNRHADKADLVAQAQKCGLILPPGEKAKDAADAWGCWVLLVRDLDRKASAEWDRRIWSPRGALL